MNRFLNSAPSITLSLALVGGLGQTGSAEANPARISHQPLTNNGGENYDLDNRSAHSGNALLLAQADLPDDDQEDIDDNEEDELDEDEDEDEEEEEENEEEDEANDTDETSPFTYDINSDADDDLNDAVLEENEELDAEGFIVRWGQILAIDMDEVALDLVQGLGYALQRQTPLNALNLSVVVLGVPADLPVREAIVQLRQEDPNTVYEFNHLYRLSNAPRQPPESGRDIYRQTLPGHHTARIGLIDTAVDQNHDSLSTARITHRNFTHGNTALFDHGTAVASLLVGKSANDFNGLLPGAALYSASVFYATPSGKPTATAESLVSALDWLMSENIPVINMSLAGPPNELLRRAVARAFLKGYIITAAVGNDGPAAPPLYPAAYSDVVAVTAVDNKLRIYRRANRGKHVDFSAQGVGVRAAKAGGGYDVFTGTSFAAPAVTALIAVGVDQPDSRQAETWLTQLQQSTRDIGLQGFDTVFGHGLVQPLPPTSSNGDLQHE